MHQHLDRRQRPQRAASDPLQIICQLTRPDMAAGLPQCGQLARQAVTERCQSQSRQRGSTLMASIAAAADGSVLA